MTTYSAGETRPLLSSTLPNQRRRLFYSVVAVFFLINAGVATAVPPTTSALKDALCARYRVHHPHRDCNEGQIQEELSVVKGLASLLLLLPGVLLGVPFGALAQHWGPKKVLLCSVAGIFMAESWFDFVCWNAQQWPIELVYLSSLFYLVGGGPSIGGSLLFVLIANGTPHHQRASRFFVLEAAGYTGSVLGSMASAAVMDKRLWTPVLAGLWLITVAFFLILSLPAELPTEQASGPWPQKPTGMRSLFAHLQHQTHLLGLLVGYLLRSLAVSVMKLLIIYAPHQFHMSFSQSGYLVSLDSAIHLAVLLILPTVGHSRAAQDATEPTFARTSVLLSASGCAAMACAPSPTLFAVGIACYGLGGGYNQLIRARLTKATPVEDRSVAYSLLGIMETLGTLLGAPLWPLVYRTGLRLAGPWSTLPFVAAAAIFVVVYITLFFF